MSQKTKESPPLQNFPSGSAGDTVIVTPIAAPGNTFVPASAALPLPVVAKVSDPISDHKTHLHL